MGQPDKVLFETYFKDFIKNRRSNMSEWVKAGI